VLSSFLFLPIITVLILFAVSCSNPSGGDDEGTYTITFNTHGGSAVTAITGTAGTVVDKPTDPEKDDLNFIAWFDAADGTVEYEWPHTLTGNVTMHAQWTSDYVVNFHPLGGSPAPTRQLVANGEKATVPSAMTVSGALFKDTITDPTTLAFDKWYIDDTYTDDWDFNDTVTGNLNLYAKWTVDSTKLAVDVSGKPGANILAKALNYIAAQTLGTKTEYTIVLADSTYTIPGIPIDIEHPEAINANIINPNAVVTLAGKSATEISLSPGSSGSLFVIAAGELALGSNITLKGSAANTASLVTVYGSGASLTIKDDAKITGNTTPYYGGGVMVVGGGSFTMSGGEISDNSTSHSGEEGGNGGGVFVYDGSFTMSGGEITGNTATGPGGGVFSNNSSFTMSGTAKITDNTTADHGGGVFSTNNSTFTMNDTAKISENTANDDGGVKVNNESTFTMNGGEISDNTVVSDNGVGGGLSVDNGSTFTMKAGAKITGNTTTYVGGGVIVHNESTFTMEGGEISGNSATGLQGVSGGAGGGVAVVDASFSKTGGILYGKDGNATDNTVSSGSNGHGVYYVIGEPSSYIHYYCDHTLPDNSGGNISTSNLPPSSGTNWTEGSYPPSP
jgi:hypothetical protein